MHTWSYDTVWTWPFHGIGPLGALLIVVFLAWLLLRDRRPRQAAGWTWPQAAAPESARDILDKRYARGEITKDQYEAMKRDLSAP
ncbi:MAG TPA: SHOCT domain-containing protein [Rhodoblastus sp.]|nr:SHOCT domain-containing protein [Rhodoblastus sp.]